MLNLNQTLRVSVILAVGLMAPAAGYSQVLESSPVPLPPQPKQEEPPAHRRPVDVDAKVLTGQPDPKVASRPEAKAAEDRRPAALIVITPNINTAKAEVVIRTTGAVKALELPRGFKQVEVKEEDDDLYGTKLNAEFTCHFAAMKAGDKQEYRIPLEIAGNGKGVVVGGIRLLNKEGQPESMASDVEFVTRQGDALVAGGTSFQALDIQLLRQKGRKMRFMDNLENRGEDDDIERKIEEIKRGGAKTVEPAAPAVAAPGRPRNDDEAHLEREENRFEPTKITGSASWTDFKNQTHPVRFAKIEVRQWRERSNHPIIATATTDDSGKFTASYENVNNDSIELYVSLKAEGDTVIVSRANDPRPYEVISSRFQDVRPGRTVDVNIVASNARDQYYDQNVSFGAYEAVNYISRHMADLGLPIFAGRDRITVKFPYSSAYGSHYRGQVLHIMPNDIKSWDVIMHEYGHYLQERYKITSNPGQPHNIASDLCSTLASKVWGVREAWGEGWPTYFGTQTQADLGLNRLQIRYVGDTSYTGVTDVGVWHFDLASQAGGASLGEGNEGAVMRALWDLNDSDQSSGDTVSLSSLEIWGLVTQNNATTFSEFWGTLRAKYTDGAELMKFGSILAEHRIAAKAISPAVGTKVFNNQPFPAFRWTGNATGCDGDYLQYAVIFYDADGNMVWFSPWQTSSQFQPTEEQKLKILEAQGDKIYWVVSTRGATPSLVTGNYLGSPGMISR